MKVDCIDAFLSRVDLVLNLSNFHDLRFSLKRFCGGPNSICVQNRI